MEALQNFFQSFKYQQNSAKIVDYQRQGVCSIDSNQDSGSETNID